MATTQPFSAQRRSTRMQFRCPVKIRAIDPDGNIFTEDTETTSISKFGASLKTNRQFSIGQIISIRTLDRDHVGQFQIVWIGESGTAGEGQIGVEWVDARLFWGIEFPPEDWAAQ
jgi:hypothetical protein